MSGAFAGVKNLTEKSGSPYEPPANLSITTDKFCCTVQSSQGVSGAVRVFLTIGGDKPSSRPNPPALSHSQKKSIDLLSS